MLSVGFAKPVIINENERHLICIIIIDMEEFKYSIDTRIIIKNINNQKTTNIMLLNMKPIIRQNMFAIGGINYVSSDFMIDSINNYIYINRYDHNRSCLINYSYYSKQCNQLIKELKKIIEQLHKLGKIRRIHKKQPDWIMQEYLNINS